MFYSCEKVDIGDKPAPWILLENWSYSQHKYIVSEDTVVKPYSNTDQYWNGEIMFLVAAPNGIKEISIKKNGVELPIIALNPNTVNYSSGQIISLHFETDLDSAIVDIMVIDLAGLTTSKRVSVFYSVSGFRPGKPIANFIVYDTEVYTGEEVYFANTTINGASYFWDFGDNTTSTAKNPYHVYETPGNYTVTLTATNNYGDSTVTKTDYIHVSLNPEWAMDADGNIYHSVKIGDQYWLVENLRTTKYNNGDPIPNVIDNSTWYSLNTGAFCYYNNYAANADTYGVMYNWYAVSDPRGIAPEGWHVASYDEWTTMQNYLISHYYNYDNTNFENKIAKAMASTTLWDNSTVPGTPGNTDYSSFRNKSGFTAYPGGMRNADLGGVFDGMGMMTWWRTSDCYSFAIFNEVVSLYSTNSAYVNGEYIRCVKD